MAAVSIIDRLELERLEREWHEWEAVRNDARGARRRALGVCDTSYSHDREWTKARQKVDDWTAVIVRAEAEMRDIQHLILALSPSTPKWECGCGRCAA